MTARADKNRVTIGGLSITGREHSWLICHCLHRTPIPGIISYREVDVQIPGLRLAHIRYQGIPNF